jgi:glutamate/aspartate transport system permease protein
MNLDFAFLNWGVVSSYVAKGFFFSIQLTLIAMIGGIALGTLLALMRLSASHGWYGRPPCM